MTYYAHGATDVDLSEADLRAGLYEALEKLSPRHRILAIPPDITRVHSGAGKLTRFALDYYGEKLTDILPALGTHAPVTTEEMDRMFPGIPYSLFRVHKWRTDSVCMGTVPGSFIYEVSGGKLNFDWPIQVNRMLIEGSYDLILSLGQVVPHEVIGMANYTKNIFVGVGGGGSIHKSHFLGAVYGMERIMGRVDSPVRAVLDYAVDHFASKLPILYILTVAQANDEGDIRVRGLFIGDDRNCYEQAAELSMKVNFTMVEKPIDRCVVYLNPHEFRSTWLGNKGIYRGRMAMADGGELLILAPGVKRFGEDIVIDRLIRKFGYRNSSSTLQAVRDNADLAANLGAAAHLIHGSPEGRFTITYAPGALSRDEIEGVGYGYADLDSQLKRYNPSVLKTGWNRAGSEEFYFIANPALGLWAHESRFID